MRLCVTGGRDWPDRAFVWRHLDRVHAHRPITTLVHGACPTGVDAHAKAWARDRGVPDEPHEAQWGQIEAPGAVVKYRADGTPYNSKAGPARNSKMIASGLDGVLVFPGGWGTADCAVKAAAAELRGELKVMQVKAPQ